MARSTWARISHSASAGLSCWTASAVVEKSVPAGLNRLGTVSLGATLPQRYVFHSLVRVRCRPRSASGCALAYSATSVSHGHGTMMLAEETERLSRAVKL